jgi:hypothetical protein
MNQVATFKGFLRVCLNTNAFFGLKEHFSKGITDLFVAHELEGDAPVPRTVELAEEY